MYKQNIKANRLLASKISHFLFRIISFIIISFISAYAFFLTLSFIFLKIKTKEILNFETMYTLLTQQRKLKHTVQT